MIRLKCLETQNAHVKLKESARRQTSGKTFSRKPKVLTDAGDNPRFLFPRPNYAPAKKISLNFPSVRLSAGNRKDRAMIKRLLLISVSFIIGLSASSARIKTNAQVNRTDPPPSQKSNPIMGSPEEEILRRAEIRHSENSHKEMVERAYETAQIGDEILASFKKSQALGRDDLKKLERMEKLARKIRGGAGGSDDEAPLDNPPAKLEAAITRLAELSETLKKSVRKTSRLVISASVINNSNELIELIRHIRSFQNP
jgi:hypothetical protein